MEKTNGGIDMLNGPLAKKILLFTLPVALSSMMKQLFNAADTAVVGLFGSGDALATVRTNTEIVALIVTISSGLSIGANIAAAKSIERDEKAALPSLGRSALVLAALIGFLGLFSRIFAAESLLTLIETPSNIFSAAKEYLQIYFLGYPFLLLYDFGAALLRAKGDSRYPFFVLIASGVINVALNLLFVLAFHKDVAGVAAATDISTAISAIAVLLRLKKDELFRKKAQKERFSLHFGADILKVGSIGGSGRDLLFCQHLCSCFGQLLRLDCHRGKRRRLEFRIFHLLCDHRVRTNGDDLCRTELRREEIRPLQKKILAVSRLFAFVKCPDDRADRAFPPRLFGAFFRRAARHRERVRPHFVYSCLRADLQFL